MSGLKQPDYIGLSRLIIVLRLFEDCFFEFAKKAEEKIDGICKFPESGTWEPLLKDKEQVFRCVHIQKRIKLIYRFDEELQTIYIEDVWITKMDPQHLLEGMK